MSVEEAGLRVSANQGPLPPAKDRSRNIFFFGGSTAFGYGVPDDRTVASCLEKRLTCESSRRVTRVYNFERFMAGRVGRLWLKTLKKDSPVLRNIRLTRKKLKALITGKAAGEARRRKYDAYDPAILGAAIERYLGSRKMIEALAGVFGVKVFFV